MLLVASIPFAFIVTLQAKQQFIRYEIMERLEQQSLHTIILSKNDVHWIKNKKEILVDGKMFDVKSFIVENGHYKFTGLFDEEETAIAEMIETGFKNDSESNKLFLSNLFSWLQTVYPNNSEDLIVIRQQDQTPTGFVTFSLPSPFKAIITPPPQVC